MSKQISEIKPGDPSTSIEVRVIKKWIPRGTKPELCYLLVDTQGDAIEAIADVNEEPYFDSIIDVGSCYAVTKYIAIPSRNYKSVVSHSASIRIGKQASFDPIVHNIPTSYFEFVTYDALEGRKRNHKHLTDFIGRIERVRNVKVNTGQELIKILLQDEGEHLIEVTLWNKSIFQKEAQTVIGKILAITSTLVTDWNGSLQLESTPATTISINPSIPNLHDYINKYKNLRSQPSLQPPEKRITIEEFIALKATVQKQTRFTCLASITSILINRTWYYAICSKCNKTVHPVKDKMTCEDHGDDIDARFMYCVNATVADETGSTNMVFFNEATNSILNIQCKDLVIKNGHTDPRELPDLILSIRGLTKMLHVTLKTDGSITVQKAENPPSHPTSAKVLTKQLQPTTSGIKRTKKDVSEKGTYNKKMKR